MAWAGIIAAAMKIAGGVAGKLFSQEDSNNAQAALQKAWDELQNINAPPELARAIIFKHLQSAGVYSPELEQHIDAGISQVAQIQEDPSLRNAQAQALQGIQQRGRVGLTAEDRVALDKVRTDNARSAEAKRQQILQNFSARGMGGSGAELAAALMSSQSGTNNEAAASDRQAATASQNALAAMTQAGTMAGNIRTQDFDVAKTKASAADEMQRFNVNNQIAMQNRNVERSNQGQQYNLNNNQRISDANTNIDNAELLRQHNAQLTDWQNQRDWVKDKAGVDKEKAGYYQNQADRTQQFWSEMGGAGGDAMSSMVPGMGGSGGGGSGGGQSGGMSLLGSGTGASGGSTGSFGVVKTPSSGGNSGSIDPSEFEAFKQYLKYRNSGS
jgi:hypothetical protein